MTETHEVIIIGGGPTAAGAVAALRAAGISDVVVLERERSAGGVPRHCGHLGFGLREFRRPMGGPRYARRIAETIAAGADLRLNSTVRVISPGGLLTVTGADGPHLMAGRAVLIATGTRESPRSARLIGGIRGPGIFTTGNLQQFVYLNRQRPARRLVVVGSELVSFSTLLTCRHGGMTIAAMIDERARPAAPWPVPWLARRLFGISPRYRTRLVEIIGRDGVEGVVIDGPQGVETIACDGVVLTGRFVAETALLARAGFPALDPGSGGPMVDQFGRCSDPCYFAAGNVVHPAESSGACFRAGLRVGAAIASALAGQLPAAGPARLVVAGGGLRYAYPQRLAGTSGAEITARVADSGRGTLRLKLDGQEVWSRRLWVAADRPLYVPARLFEQPFTTAELDFQ